MTFSLSCVNAENNDASVLAQHVLVLTISMCMNETYIVEILGKQ